MMRMIMRKAAMASLHTTSIGMRLLGLLLLLAAGASAVSPAQQGGGSSGSSSGGSDDSCSFFRNNNEKTDAFGIIEWIRGQPGGIFHPSQELRLEESSSSRWMLYATEDIPKGEILSKIPWQSIIMPPSSSSASSSSSGDDNSSPLLLLEDIITRDGLNCDTTRVLAQELRLAKQESASSSSSSSSAAASSKSSFFAPYIQYLNALVECQPQQPKIPSAWSNAGKELLLELLGGIDPDLPPGAPVNVLEEDWYTNCQGDDDNDDGAVAASLILQRGLYDTFMVPTYDWYTHRNGNYYNIETNLHILQAGAVPGAGDDADKNFYFEIKARRDIQAGEPLHNSYDLCDQCDEEAVESGYGTPEIFRDYGVIEQYPQRWTFQPNAVVLETQDGVGALYAPEQLTFELVEVQGDDDDDDDHNTDDKTSIHVQWAEHLQFDDRARNYIRRIFRKHLRKLYRFQNIHYDLLEDDNDDDGGGEEEEKEEEDSVIPPTEWKQIRAYYRAIGEALQFAIQSLENEDDETAEECQEDIMSSNEGACEAALLDIYGSHFDDLKEEEDYLQYIFPSCATTQLLEFEQYETIEDLQTNYQKLWFVTREADDDVCMNLENTLQICSNYRPHYHEFFVHFPARFMNSIERVIFIGGGDSMLLHEVLKYPSLQKVVGLELDQQVTRKSFQHFHSQPHWDNDKVEWWYGDATKSLPLLPRDYWGSFDLVLVDLSETVMSFSVTKTMDIFSALSLLLKPEGIMVKNEPYIDQFSDFFDHTIQIFYGTPKICTQVLVMGSNQVDFLHHPTKDHRVDRLLLEPLDDIKSRDYKYMHIKSRHYKYMHDYRKTDARQQGKCNDQDGIIGSIEHGAKAGFIEILEAYNVSYDFETEHLETTLFNVAKEQGLTPLSPPMVHSKGPISVMVMKEGYMVGRTTTSDTTTTSATTAADANKYIAFDIHLWGAFSKMESLRAALLKAVGAETSSFYRVVAGGMHGTSTWDNDKDDIGIEITQPRNCQTNESKKHHEGLAKDDYDLATLALKVSLKESLRFVPPKETTVALVLCGLESKVDCASAQVLSKIEGRTIAIEPIWACPPVSNFTDMSLEIVDHMYECEKSMLRQLLQFVAKHEDDEDIDMVIIDPSAPRAMGQVLNSIFSVSNNREALLSDQNVFVAFSKKSNNKDSGADKENGWRMNVLERYRKESHFFPVSRAEVAISAGSDQEQDDDHDHEYALHIAAVNDRLFFQHLHDLEKNLQAQLMVDPVDDGNGPSFEPILVEAKSIIGGMHYFDSEYDSRVFPPDAYDPQPALAQAAEQIPVGRQGIFQFEFIEEKDEEGNDGQPPRTSIIKIPSIEELNQALQETIQEVLGIEAKNIQRWSTFKEVGEGAAAVAIFSGGNVMMVWDGRTHVDLNLYYSLDQSKSTADLFVDTFASKTSLTKTLRDDQPRGPGRVVQFDHEIIASNVCSNEAEEGATKAE